MKRLESRQQRTLSRDTEVHGRGIVTGTEVHLRFVPAPEDTGVVFHRVDLAHEPRIPARADVVTGTRRRTTIGAGPSQVTLTEHVLAALAGMRIDNCIIELDGPEPPGLDGSSKGFVEAILAAGSINQPRERSCYTPDETIHLKQGGATLTFYPSDNRILTISYILDYGQLSSIQPQIHTCEVTPENFRRELSATRTFVLEIEAQELQKQGIGLHLTPAELIVFGPTGPIDNTLRFPDEPARHKILDLIGDLALCGFDLSGHLVAYRSGHPLNVEMAKVLLQRANQNGSSRRMRLAA